MKIKPLVLIAVTATGVFITSRLYHSQPQVQTQELVATSFRRLPHWNSRQHAQSFKAFQISCQSVLKKNPDEPLGLESLHTTAKDWFPVCHKALTYSKGLSNNQAKAFFEHYFTPYAWLTVQSGLFTGYYSPLFKGSLEKTAEFSYPVYGPPNDLIRANLKEFSPKFPNKIIFGKLQGKQFVPYDDRQAINNGAIQTKATVIAWLSNPMDALELEIQGAGTIHTKSGLLTLNYAAQNGHPYIAIGKFLIEDKKLRRKDVTMLTIRSYFKKHPKEVSHYFNKNPSYVFFKTIDKPLFYGALNIPLSPGYSLAIDPNFIPLGTPVFLSTTLPNHQHFNRLMIAQDIGGAIKGPIRGDIYWGTGHYAQRMASTMKQQGTYWMLIPIQR